VRPEHLRVWRLLSGAVAVLDSWLRLSVSTLDAICDMRYTTYDIRALVLCSSTEPTQRHQGPLARREMLAQRIVGGSGRAACRGRQIQDRGGRV
jgi:hypothetical protein